MAMRDVIVGYISILSSLVAIQTQVETGYVQSVTQQFNKNTCVTIEVIIIKVTLSMPQ